jgi:hypothetical protein
MNKFGLVLVLLAAGLVYLGHAQYNDFKPLPERAKDLMIRRMLIGKGCPGCKEIRCPGRAKQCTRGILRDACNCCNICARNEGEVCGGKYYIHGKCAQEAHCDLRRATIDNPVGVCVNNDRAKK